MYSCNRNRPLLHIMSTWGIDFDTPINVPIYATGSGHLKQLYGGCSPLGVQFRWATGYPLIMATIGPPIFPLFPLLGPLVYSRRREREAGQLVGYAGLSGTTSTASHLHYDKTPSPQSLPVNHFSWAHLLLAMEIRWSNTLTPFSGQQTGKKAP
ncbi:MAG: hypothetical protein CM15mP49_15450 [Actinomycetota bacterium]|nr:MAG: hypothetical protein CM15mP49_15450 [Actinomycetota bacterium]